MSDLARTNSTKYAILGVLSMKPSSGYDIKKFCDGGIAHFWNENYGHIYPMLKQMEEDGWITKQTEVNEGKPPRNVYSITEAGRKKLAEWLVAPAESPPARYEFLLKMFFSKDIPPETVIARLEKSKATCADLLKSYRKLEENLKRRMDEGTDNVDGVPYWFSTLRYGIISIEGDLKWCEETIELIKSRTGGIKIEKDSNT